MALSRLSKNFNDVEVLIYSPDKEGSGIVLELLKDLPAPQLVCNVI
jgi:hypothetical protein